MTSYNMVRQHLFNISELATHVKRQKMRMKWGTGLQPIMEPSWIVPSSSSKVIRLGGARSGLSAGSLGCFSVSSLQRQNVCLWRLQVNCSWGTKRRKSHHRKRRDYRLLNAEDYTFRPPPRSRRMQMSVWIKKKKKDRKTEREKEKKPFCNLFGRKKTQVLWLSWEWVNEFVLHFFFFFFFVFRNELSLPRRLPDGM